MGIATQIGSPDTWYEVVFYLHILTAIIGLGAVMLNGLHAAQGGKRGGREELAISESVEAVAKVAEYFIYAIFVTGLLMALTAKDGSAIEISDFWLSAAMFLFIVALGISHGVLNPSVKKYNAALKASIEASGGSPDGPTPEMEAAGKRTAMAGATLNVIVVVILYLMVWKPGSGFG